jgi:hypothetical protein
MMKTIRYILITLAAVTGLAALAACAQPVTPAVHPGGTTGRVILSVSAGTPGAARTILPTTTPAFSRYELVFSTSGESDVSVTNTTGIDGAGVSQDLKAGTWTAMVSAYRRFTPSGGADTEYLAARGSEPVTVTGGANTPVTVTLEPVQAPGGKGIFTYTVTFPGLVSTATLTLTGAGTPITEHPVSGTKVSIAVDPGYYDLTLSLENYNGTLTAGTSERVHIYSGLESAAAFTFTDADFAQTIPFAGTVTLPENVVVKAGTIGVYNADYTSYFGTAAIPAGGTAWTVGVPASYAGQTLSFKLDAFGSNGKIYTATKNTDGPVTAAGKKGITLGTVSEVTPTALTENTLTSGAEISPRGEVDWYKFTAAASGVDYYHLQWDSSANASGTLYGYVSAYRTSGTPVFTQGSNSPLFIGVSPSETIYIRVEGSYGNTGTYALKYYQSGTAGSAPTAYPSYMAAQGNPKPACVVSWRSLSDATGYKVYRSTDGTSYGFLGTVSGAGNINTYSYTDTTVTAGATYYYKVSAVNGNPGEGPQSPAVSDTIPTTGTGTVLTENTATTGAEISVAGEVDWYKFTAATAGTYYVQWDDTYNSAGGKTLVGYVSAFRAGDGTPVFVRELDGFTRHREVSVSAGETIYIRVENQYGTGTGTYAVLYYRQ